MSGVVIDRIRLPFDEHDPERILSAYAAALQPKTKVISVSHVLAPTGLRMPVAEIARLARSRGVLCVVDGAQAVGQINVDVRSIGCDAYATSGHKWLMGPKGTGIVYIAKGAETAFDPPQWQLGRAVGSDSAGLAPLTMAVGLGEAIDAALTLGINRIEAYNRRLGEFVFAGMAKIPQLRVVSAAPSAYSTAMVAAVLPATIDAERICAVLRKRHNVVIKLAEKRWFNGIRLSPHVFNDEAQVAKGLAALRTELGR
jgi:selenocysteine lyase/cysteine desulfurase